MLISIGTFFTDLQCFQTKIYYHITIDQLSDIVQLAT